MRLILCLVLASYAFADNPHNVTVMSRNMDAGTDLNYILAAPDLPGLIAGTAATLDEIVASGIPARAALLANEIAVAKPDLIALQEVTLWRTGPFMAPPATTVLYDQLSLLMTEIAQRKLPYSIVAIQSLMDAEAPVPLANLDLRITDRNVILARNDLPRSQFELTNIQTKTFAAIFEFESPLLGVISQPTGWMSVDVKILKNKFRFVNTHLQSVAIPALLPVQLAQIAELTGALANAGMPVVLAGDFNANAEPGPEHTGGVEALLAAGFTDTWKEQNPFNPGYTWPLFGEDQLSGPAVPNERIDLILCSGDQLTVLAAERTGLTSPWPSDHSGVVTRLQVK